MVREMHFIEVDRDALFWAVGSVATLFRYSIRHQLRASIERALSSVTRTELKNIVRNTGGILYGAGLAAGALALCLFAFLAFLHFQSWHLRCERLSDGLLISLVPVAGYLLAILMLWKRKRCPALGVLIAGLILLAHVIVHHVAHG
jgi:hypothetical protein